MVQDNRPQFNPGVIEALKAATRQVVQSAPRNENPGSSVVTIPVAPKARSGPQQNPMSMPASGNFIETFVRKITAMEQENTEIEQEQFAVQQELDRVQKLQSGLTERKEQLEQRRNELLQVKNKLTAIDKEINDVLKSPSL